MVTQAMTLPSSNSTFMHAYSGDRLQESPLKITRYYFASPIALRTVLAILSETGYKHVCHINCLSTVILGKWVITLEITLLFSFVTSFSMVINS